MAAIPLNSLAHFIMAVAGCAKMGRQKCELGSAKVRRLVAKSAKLVGDSANLQNDPFAGFFWRCRAAGR